MDHWICANQNIIANEADNANEIIEKVKYHQDRIDHIKSIIKNTLDGGIQKIKNELKADIDRFFDARHGEILKDIKEFIRSYQISYHKYEDTLRAAGFSNTLYIVFQEFKQALDTFMAETINPEVIRFVREKESQIKERLDSIADPFDALMKDAIVEYKRMTGSFGVSYLPENKKRMDLPDINPIKDVAGLTIPPAVASMRYSARIKTEAVMRLGFYTVVKIFKRLLKKPIVSNKEDEILALKDGVLRIKRETERSIVFHFKDYRENIKFQYIFKLVEAVSNSHHQFLLDRFRAHVSDLSGIVELISNNRINKEQAFEFLKEMNMASKKIRSRIIDIRKEIEGGQ
jgi:hypothetical protein